jgi:hypothetical protein
MPLFDLDHQNLQWKVTKRGIHIGIPLRHESFFIPLSLALPFPFFLFVPPFVRSTCCSRPLAPLPSIVRTVAVFCP